MNQFFGQKLTIFCQKRDLLAKKQAGAELKKDKGFWAQNCEKMNEGSLSYTVIENIITWMLDC